MKSIVWVSDVDPDWLYPDPNLDPNPKPYPDCIQVKKITK